jgi:predicted molibdopterin-dependent oxidoreductase YjgC
LGKITVKFNDKEVEGDSSMTVLEVARAGAVYIPTLCADPDLKPYGGCRLCLVEIEKMRGLQTACTTPARDGMIVKLDTPYVQRIRKQVLELIVSDHPGDCLMCARDPHCPQFNVCLRDDVVSPRCVVCPRNGTCELQQVVEYVGLKEVRYRRTHREAELDTSNSFFYRDHDKCIYCARCVRVCEEVQGVAAIDLGNRGKHAKIVTALDAPLAESNCESCGQCMAKCPVGAIVIKNYRGEPQREVQTICPYCGVGCSLHLQVKDEKIIGSRGDRAGQANRGSLCVKGQFGQEFVSHPDRLTTPLVKKNGQLVEATWEDAIALVADRFVANRGKFAALASAKCTNEENYLFQKFARGVMGTNNVDHCART